MKRILVFICSLLAIFLISVSNSKSACVSDNDPVVVSDTISNYVVERHGSYATVSKIGVATSRKLVTSSFNYNESGNKSALVQCTVNYSKEKMTEIIESALMKNNDNSRKVGRLMISIILSRALNVENFEIRGQGLDALTSKEILDIYYAINFSQLFVTWTEPVPYVVFGMQVVI